MAYATTVVTCDWDDCGAEYEISAEVVTGWDDHPYGSTTARENWVEVDMDENALACPKCGGEVGYDDAVSMLVAAL